MRAIVRRSLAWIGVITVVLTLAGCGGAPAPSLAHEVPAVVEAIDGDESRHRITLTEKAAQRLGIELAEAAAATGSVGSVHVPYSAVIYDAEGKAWAYVAEQPLVFVREPVTVHDVLPNATGGVAVLSEGPPVGTPVVSVGVAELFGTEFEVGH